MSIFEFMNCKTLIIFFSFLFASVVCNGELHVSNLTKIEVANPNKKGKTASVNGTYYCSKTREYYTFKSDHTGSFVTGSVSSKFRWTLKGSFVIITYSNGGKTELQYNRSSDYLLESSSMLGTLLYEKRKSR